MSWGCYLIDPKTKEPIQLEEKHHLAGGIYAVGGTTEAYFNVTYNYSTIIRAVIGDGLSGALDGKVAVDTVPLLQDGISRLIEDNTPCDYWTASEGNVKKALQGLLALAEMAPHGIWEIT